MDGDSPGAGTHACVSVTSAAPRGFLNETSHSFFRYLKHPEMNDFSCLTKLLRAHTSDLLEVTCLFLKRLLCADSKVLFLGFCLFVCFVFKAKYNILSHCELHWSASRY